MATTTSPPPKMPPAPPPPAATKSNRPIPTTKGFKIARGVRPSAQRVVLYGVGGVGKTTLASLAPSPLFLDLEHGSHELDVARVERIEVFQDLRDALHSKVCDDFETVVIDSATSAQDLAIAHTIANVPHEKGKAVRSIEDYGFGKGYQHTYETFLLMLADLDGHIRGGRNVILICHDRTETAPNPDGEDYLRYEPDLQQPPKTGRIRDRVKNWTDHLLFIQYDRVVIDGKARGSGSRTIYPQEMATFWAKSRKLNEPVAYELGDATVWNQIFTERKLP